jgi:hypothetical protein
VAVLAGSTSVVAEDNNLAAGEDSIHLVGIAVAAMRCRSSRRLVRWVGRCCSKPVGVVEGRMVGDLMVRPSGVVS